MYSRRGTFTRGRRHRGLSRVRGRKRWLKESQTTTAATGSSSSCIVVERDVRIRSLMKKKLQRRQELENMLLLMLCCWSDWGKLVLQIIVHWS